MYTSIARLCSLALFVAGLLACLLAYVLVKLAWLRAGDLARFQRWFGEQSLRLKHNRNRLLTQF